MKHSRNPRRQPPQVVAIIPARGGRQSIPYKNLLPFAGKPLLYWSVTAGFAAKTIDLVAVSTEDKKIARYAASLGALVIPRPARYSRPESDDSGWYFHAVQWLEKHHGWRPEIWVNLRPTAPIRFPRDIDACVRHVQRTGCDGLKTVVPSPIHPFKMWTMNQTGRLQPLVQHPYREQHGPDQPRQRIQKIFPVYWQDANIDITRRRFILSAPRRGGNCFGPNLHGYLLDSRWIVDIDSLQDLRYARRLLARLRAAGLRLPGEKRIETA
jgi:N-acylneuraminate cytidylyltransferase